MSSMEGKLIPPDRGRCHDLGIKKLTLNTSFTGLGHSHCCEIHVPQSASTAVHMDLHGYGSLR